MTLSDDWERKRACFVLAVQSRCGLSVLPLLLRVLGRPIRTRASLTFESESLGMRMQVGAVTYHKASSPPPLSPASRPPEMSAAGEWTAPLGAAWFAAPVVRFEAEGGAVASVYPACFFIWSVGVLPSSRWGSMLDG